MKPIFGRFFSGCLAAGLLAGCQPGAVSLPFKLITTSCVSPAPLDGVTHLEFIVTGPGMQPVSTVATVNIHNAQLPDVPPGPLRRLEARGYSGDPRSLTSPGRILSLGRSHPFTVASSPPPGAPPAPVQVVLRRVNTLVPVGNGASCQSMESPRAAHSASLLPDGRVFVAGGFTLGANRVRRTLKSTELFDPIQGTFTPATDLGGPVPGGRAFHSSTLLPAGPLFIAGGESTVGGSTTILQDGLLIDPVLNTAFVVALVGARSHHGAAAAGDGGILLVGGLGDNGAMASSVEAYTPGAAVTQPTGDKLALQEMAVATGPDGASVVVAGGFNGQATVSDITLFSYDATGFHRTATSALAQARRLAAIAGYPAGTVTVFGGYPDPAGGQSAPLANSEIIAGGPGGLSVSNGPALTPRAQLCAVSLSAGQVFTAGGISNSAGSTSTVTATELFTLSPAGLITVLGMPPLPGGGRYLHTCTMLEDGSALILGGEDSTTSPPQVLQDALVFMPPPLN